MDCVNHSGVNAAAYCQNCGKALCAGMRAQRAGRADFLRAVLDGVAERATAVCAAARGSAQPGAGGLSGTDSRRGRDVQRPVHQGPGSRGDLRGAGERGARLRRLRPVHRGVDLLPGVRGLPHGEGAARRRAVARSAGTERGEQLVRHGRSTAPGNAARGASREPGQGRWARGRRAPYQAPSQTQYQPPYQAPYQTPYQGPYVPPGYAGPACSAGSARSARASGGGGSRSEP